MKFLVTLTIFSITIASGLGYECQYFPSDIQFLFYSLQNPNNPITIISNNAAQVQKTHFNKAKDTILLVHGAGGYECQYFPSDIQFLFYSLQNPNNPITIISNNAAQVQKTHFNKAKDTILLVHGAGGNSSGPLVQKVKTAVANAKIDVNLIAVDWLRFQNRNNKVIIYNCSKLFGKVVGTFLQQMNHQDGLDFSKLTMVGHSVAGALCEAIGYQLNKQVRNIIGLECCSHVDSAKFVECVHTSSADYPAMAHGNYYPNGGGEQPHCESNDWKCKHWRVIDYYVESITSGKFIGHNCNNYADYKAGKCGKNAVGVLGGLTPRSTAQGKFYLATNDVPPYAKG